MAIKGKTFDLQTITAKDDGALYRMLSGYNDICIRAGSGTFLSISSNTLTIGECFVIVAGRYIHIQDGSTVSLGSIPTTAGKGRLILRIDTSKSASESDLAQVETEVETTTSSGVFRSLVKNNINADNGGTVYEVQFCSFNCSSGSASSPVRSMADATPVADLQSEVSSMESNKANAGFGTTSLTDLNEITTAGWYWINANITTQNMPTASSGLLEVIRTTNNELGAIVQRYASTSPLIYERMYINNAWTDWRTFPYAPVDLIYGGTGATTLRDAQYNLQNWLANGTLINSNSDLNDYFNPGVYKVGTSTIAATISNMPEALSGKLVVLWLTNSSENNQYAAQFFFPNSRTYFYYRTKAAGTPSAWNLVGGGGVTRVRFRSFEASNAVTGLAQVQNTAVMLGNSFVSATAGNTYFSVPAGTYRVTLRANVTMTNVAAPQYSAMRIWIATASDPTNIPDTPTMAYDIGATAKGINGIANGDYVTSTGVMTFTETTYIGLAYYGLGNGGTATGPSGNPFVLIERMA